jgi:transglutaminase-like putative cysteine protease
LQGEQRSFPIRLAWFIAFLLAIVAGLQAGVHLILPRVKASSHTVALAQKFLVQRSERRAFDQLAALPIWNGQRIGSIVEHAHLAQYNRQIINWQIDESIYRDYVLDPRVNTKADGALDWRRMLWESCYPRIRREERAEAAAEVILRHLRERITVRKGEGWPVEVSLAWEKQITSPRGFAGLYTSALRSCGVPARLNAAGQAEGWNGSEWKVHSLTRD